MTRASKSHERHDICLGCHEDIRGAVVEGKTIKLNLDGTVHACKVTLTSASERVA